MQRTRPPAPSSRTPAGRAVGRIVVDEDHFPAHAGERGAPIGPAPARRDCRARRRGTTTESSGPGTGVTATRPPAVPGGSAFHRGHQGLHSTPASGGGTLLGRRIWEGPRRLGGSGAHSRHRRCLRRSGGSSHFAYSSARLDHRGDERPAPQIEMLLPIPGRECRSIRSQTSSALRSHGRTSAASAFVPADGAAGSQEICGRLRRLSVKQV